MLATTWGRSWPLASAATGGAAVLVASLDRRVWEVADRVVRLDAGRVAM